MKENIHFGVNLTNETITKGDKETLSFDYSENEIFETLSDARNYLIAYYDNQIKQLEEQKRKALKKYFLSDDPTPYSKSEPLRVKGLSADKEKEQLLIKNIPFYYPSHVDYQYWRDTKNEKEFMNKLEDLDVNTDGLKIAFYGNDFVVVNRIFADCEY